MEQSDLDEAVFVQHQIKLYANTVWRLPIQYNNLRRKARFVQNSRPNRFPCHVSASCQGRIVLTENIARFIF